MVVLSDKEILDAIKILDPYAKHWTDSYLTVGDDVCFYYVLIKKKNLKWIFF